MSLLIFGIYFDDINQVALFVAVVQMPLFEYYHLVAVIQLPVCQCFC